MSARATRSKLAHLMAHIMFSPPYIPPAQAAQSLRTHGYAVLQPEDFAQWMGLSVNDLQAMDADWQGLPPDAFLKDGGRYRRRRHSCFVSDGDHVQQPGLRMAGVGHRPGPVAGSRRRGFARLPVRTPFPRVTFWT